MKIPKYLLVDTLIKYNKNKSIIRFTLDIHINKR